MEPKNKRVFAIVIESTYLLFSLSVFPSPLSGCVTVLLLRSVDLLKGSVYSSFFVGPPISSLFSPPTKSFNEPLKL